MCDLCLSKQMIIIFFCSKQDAKEKGFGKKHENQPKRRRGGHQNFRGNMPNMRGRGGNMRGRPMPGRGGNRGMFQ